jgi:hypothetical protein
MIYFAFNRSRSVDVFVLRVRASATAVLPSGFLLGRDATSAACTNALAKSITRTCRRPALESKPVPLTVASLH